MANSFTLDVLNTIRANASEEYQNRIPVATKENIAAIGNTFAEYDNIYNEYSTALFHKIGLTLLLTNSFENKLKKFKTGSLTTGQDVEEIFVDQFRAAEGAYDKTGVTINPFARRQYNDVKVYYHRMNRQDKYVISIAKEDHIRAFRSESTLSSFIAAQFNSLYTGSEWDEWTIMKKMIGETAETAFTYEVEDPTTQAKCMSFARTIKKAIADLSYVSTAYNPAAVKTKSDKNELVLFIHKDIAPHLDVDLYSVIFGPNYTQTGVSVIELDDFGPLNDGTRALLVDKDFFKIYDVKHEMTQLFNPDNLVTNYWLHVWQILSTSNFKNRVAFKVKGA